ncbi:MAG: hypothetical protein ACI3V2_06715 [Faecousia sp.]
MLETASEQQPTEPPETERASQSEPADPTVYCPVIEHAIAEMQEVGYGDGKGMLYDLDGDDTDELILLYFAEMDEGHGLFQYAVCSVYKNEGKAVALLEKYPLFPLAGGPSGFVGIVEVDGETFFAIHSESGESDMECYYGNGVWRLYSFDGTVLQEEHSVDYVCAMRFGEGGSEVVYDQSSAVFDGIPIGYAALESWESRVVQIKTMKTFAYDEEEALSLSALLESLSTAD